MRPHFCICIQEEAEWATASSHPRSCGRAQGKSRGSTRSDAAWRWVDGGGREVQKLLPSSAAAWKNTKSLHIAENSEFKISVQNVVILLSCSNRSYFRATGSFIQCNSFLWLFSYLNTILKLSLKQSLTLLLCVLEGISRGKLIPKIRI